MANENAKLKNNPFEGFWIAGYLSCFIDTDGCFKISRPPSLTPQIQFESTNYELIIAIRKMLDIFGIKYSSGIVREKKKNLKQYYHVTISKLTEVKKALKVICPIGKRKQWKLMIEACENRKDRERLKSIRQQIMELNKQC